METKDHPNAGPLGQAWQELSPIEQELSVDAHKRMTEEGVDAWESLSDGIKMLYAKAGLFLVFDQMLNEHFQIESFMRLQPVPHALIYANGELRALMILCYRAQCLFPSFHPIEHFGPIMGLKHPVLQERLNNLGRNEETSYHRADDVNRMLGVAVLPTHLRLSKEGFASREADLNARHDANAASEKPADDASYLEDSDDFDFLKGLELE